jgi:hypothetical protein
MQTIIALITGEQIHLPMRWGEVEQQMARMGTIELKGGEGIRRLIPKSAIISVHEFTDDAWAKLQADAEAQRKAQASGQARQRAEAQLAAWKARPWAKKIFRKPPVVFPNEKIAGTRDCGQ